ncbi:MAG: phytanoyl-CoA dioxygenase family protein [Pseudomonadota bacterium]
MHYEATTADHQHGALPAQALTRLSERLASDGYVIIAGLIRPDACQRLRAAVLEDVARVRADAQLTPHEKHTAPGHLQLGLRRYAPFVAAEVVANPLIEQMVAQTLGARAWLGFFNGNVNCPGSGHQPLHFDRPFSWRSAEEAAADGVSWPPPTTTLSCSIALTDITVETGATEIYPGTHRETACADWTQNRLAPYPELIERWGPPQAMEIPAGGVCFRDPRMWHRGMPNHDAQPRPMPALTYHSARALHWQGRMLHDVDPSVLNQCQANPHFRVLADGTAGDARLVFHRSAEDAFLEPSLHGVERNVRFVDATVDHLHDAHRVGGARISARTSPDGLAGARVDD